MGRLTAALALIALPFALCMITAVQGGCFIPALIGGMAESYAEVANHTVEAEYKGLEGKSFVVVVTADRSIESTFPALVPAVTEKIFEHLYKESGASGCIPPVQSLAFLYNNPRWLARPRAELAKELGVERLVNVEIQEFRVNDPGNQYLWDGVALGTVGVLESDTTAPDLYSFEKQVMVKFPDKSGMGPTDISGQVVQSELLVRFVNRASWPFYEHEEKIRPDY
jgi:hypothetical protein